METIQTIRTLHGNVQRCKGRITGTKRKAQERTALPATDGFLKCRFVPMVMGKAYLKDWKQIEGDFFCSYQHFVTAYGLPALDYSDNIYPYNIFLAYRQIKAYMEQVHCYEDVMIAEHEYSKCCIATSKCYNTNMTLYYIPLRPLHQLQKDKAKRPQYNLLLSVCSYLMEVVRIPSYQYGDYIGRCHEILEQWTIDEYGDLDADFRNEAQSEYREAEYFGIKLYKQMKHPYHLQQWEHRLKTFKVMDTLDAELFNVATEAYRLFLDYPKQTFYKNIHPDFFMPEEQERTSADQYISFIWSESGWLYEQLIEMVNLDLQEHGIIDEPLLIHTFDKQGGTLVDNLTFEKRLFQLLDNLSDTLYTISDGQHNTTI